MSGPARSETAVIGDCTVDVLRHGAGDQIVVLHGAYGSLFLDPLIDALSVGHEVLVPHHPGWRASTRPDHVRTIRDVALVQQEFLERFERPVPVIGLSVGGWIASEIAATCPGLITELVLVSPVGIKVGGRDERDFVDLYVTETGARRRLFSGATGLEGERATGEAFYVELAKAEEAVARYCWAPYMHDPGLGARMRRITASTMLLSGGADHFVVDPGRYYAAYARLLGDRVEHRIVDGVGHCIEEECPGAVATAVDDLLRSRVAVRSTP